VLVDLLVDLSLLWVVDPCEASVLLDVVLVEQVATPCEDRLPSNALVVGEVTVEAVL